MITYKIRYRKLEKQHKIVKINAKLQKGKSYSTYHFNEQENLFINI